MKLQQYVLAVVLPFDGQQCLLWPFARNSEGYGHCWLDGRLQYVHRWICEKAHGPAPSRDHEAAHSCGNGDQGCCNRRHLRWATHAQNVAETVEHGKNPHGEVCWNATLTEEQVLQILFLKGKVRQRIIAWEFKTSRENVSRIHRGLNWAWLASHAQELQQEAA